VADLGKEILISAELAMKEANAHQTNGVSFRLSARDDLMSGATAATAAKGLIAQENAIAVVAAGISAVVKGTVEALNGQGVTVITPTATDSRLADGKDFVFRVIPPNSAQADALAKFAAAFPARKTALVFQQDDYSKDLKDGFAAAFKKLGGEITMEIGFEPDETDFRAHLDALKNSGAEMILCAAQHVPVARFLVRAREMGLQQPVLSGETAYTDKLLEVAGKATQGLFLVGPAVDLNNPDENLKRYLDGYASRTGKRPGIYGCYTYDAVNLLTDVIVNSRAANRSELLTALRAVKDYQGVTGPITFDNSGNVLREYRIFSVKDGRFERVK
jgi:branched-chain amino acid transport system substrate-binding protein